MFSPYETARVYADLKLEFQEDRGFGLFAQEFIKCGQTIIDEVCSVIDSIYDKLLILNVIPQSTL